MILHRNLVVALLDVIAHLGLGLLFVCDIRLRSIQKSKDLLLDLD
jgi:hypothetical protein